MHHVTLYRLLVAFCRFSPVLFFKYLFVLTDFNLSVTDAAALGSALRGMPQLRELSIGE
jgi:hypothetical protein